MSVPAMQLQTRQPSLKIDQIRHVSNPVSVHGIYPYRGKISALDATNIINQLQPGTRMLDPFCGSGTIVFEAQRFGIETHGFDTNPLAVWLSNGKLDLMNKTLEEISLEARQIVAKAEAYKSAKLMPEVAAKHFHPSTAVEIMSLLPHVREASKYLQACFWGTIALAARGCNHYQWTSSTVGKDINPKRYINVHQKFLYKAIKHFSQLNNNVNSKIYHTDSRSLSSHLTPNSIDYVFTSPPYFDGLDYSSYYAKIIYAILGMDRTSIRETLIQNAKTYEEDMKIVLSEILKVTHSRSLIIFVVGDKKNGKETINGGAFFSQLLHHEPNYVVERTYTKSSSQIFDKLNGTKRKEQIVVWDRGTW